MKEPFSCFRSTNALATAAKFLFLMAEYLAATSAREAYGFALMQIDRQAGQSNGFRVSSFIVETHIFKGTLHVLVLMLFNFTQ